MATSGSEGSLASLASSSAASAETSATAGTNEEEEEEADEVDEAAPWRVKVDKKAMGLGLMKDAKAVTAHLLSLSQDELAKLQLELEATGFAQVLGLAVKRDWVAITKPLKPKKKKAGGSVKRVSSSNSLNRQGSSLAKSSSNVSLLSMSSSSGSLSGLGGSTGNLASLALSDSSAQPQQPSAFTMEDRAQALARVAAAGSAYKLALSECGGDRGGDAAVYAEKELKASKDYMKLMPPPIRKR